MSKWIKQETPESILEWKNHNGFYTSLNTFLDLITETEIRVYTNFGEIYVYFAQINSLFSKHYAYIPKNEEVKRKLKAIRSGLYARKVFEALEKNPKEPNLQGFIIKVYDDLSDIYRKILIDLKRNDLLPNPKEIEFDPNDSKRRGIAA